MRTTRRALLVVIGLGLALSPAACRKRGDPVQETLDAMVAAANARDVEALFSRVAPDFQAADGSSRADAEATVRRYFSAYEILTVSISNVQVEKGENAARVRLRAEMSGQPRKVGGLDGLIPSSAKYDFDLRLTSDGKTWKVAWAQWAPAE